MTEDRLSRRWFVKLGVGAATTAAVGIPSENSGTALAAIQTGVDWFPEKALFQEYVKFGRHHAHDLADFKRDRFQEVRGQNVPGGSGGAIMRALILSLFVFSAMACTSAPPDPAQESAGLSDAEIGLSGHSVFDDPPQRAAGLNTFEPGDSDLRGRSYPDAPPVVPHSILDFAVITGSENACIDCHDKASAEDFGAVAIPASHYRDLRHAPDDEREDIAGARYNCTTCHVQQTDARPLVDMRRP